MVPNDDTGIAGNGIVGCGNLGYFFSDRFFKNYLLGNNNLLKSNSEKKVLAHSFFFFQMGDLHKAVLQKETQH